MSYERLMELTKSPAYALNDWREIIKEIDIELLAATSEEKRSSLLQMFKATMDIAETTIVPDSLETFRESRRKHYLSHVVQEATVGGNVCVETLLAVTSREIAAGRMSENDDVRKAAVDGCAAPHLTRAELQARAIDNTSEEKTGVLGRFASLARRVFK